MTFTKQNIAQIQTVNIFWRSQEIHLGKCETGQVLLFTSLSRECKQVSDQSMLVFCFCRRTFLVYLRTRKVHNNSVFYSRNPTCEIPPCLWISNCKYPLFLQNSSSKNPLPFGNPKSRPWYRYGYFLESPISLTLHVCRESMDASWNCAIIIYN